MDEMRSDHVGTFPGHEAIRLDDVELGRMLLEPARTAEGEQQVPQQLGRGPFRADGYESAQGVLSEFRGAVDGQHGHPHVTRQRRLDHLIIDTALSIVPAEPMRDKTQAQRI